MRVCSAQALKSVSYTEIVHVLKCLYLCGRGCEAGERLEKKKVKKVKRTGDRIGLVTEASRENKTGVQRTGDRIGLVTECSHEKKTSVQRTEDRIGLVTEISSENKRSIKKSKGRCGLVTEVSNENESNVKKSKVGSGLVTEEKGKRRLSKKQVKVTVIVVAIVLAVTIITTATVLGVLHTIEKRKNNTGKYTNLIAKNYQYAMNSNDTDGILLANDFMLDIPFESFKVNVSEGFKVDENMRLKVVNYSLIGDSGEATVTFVHDDVVFATIKVKVFSGATYIRTIEDLKAIPDGAAGIYVQVADMDADAQKINILNFAGKYYGNHHTIKNLDISETKGLFKNLKNAYIYSLSLLEVKGNIVNNITSSVGALANSAEYTIIEKCVVTGAFTVKHESRHDSISVGGLVGEMKGKKKIRETAFLEEIKSCQTNISIDIESVGQVFAGGVSGKLIESTVADGYSFGSLAVRVLKGEELRGIYIGGISGVLEKEYTDVQFLYVMDLGEKLYSDSKIIVDVNGGGDGIMIYAGGLYGMVKNHRLKNAIYKGEFSIKTGHCNGKIGGIVGVAKNTTTLDMTIRAVKVDTNLNIITSGTVIAGGIIGELTNVTFDNVVKTSMPVVTTKTDNAAASLIVGEYVGKEVSSAS